MMMTRTSQNLIAYSIAAAAAILTLPVTAVLQVGQYGFP